MRICHEVAKTHQFIPSQTPQILWNAGFHGRLGLKFTRMQADAGFVWLLEAAMILAWFGI
jgi:hypothetical protein